VSNIARIKPVPSEEFIGQPEILNEWFVDITGLGSPGKTALLFVHRTTYLTIIVPGRSLLKAIPEFISRLEKLLIRHNVSQYMAGKIIDGLDPAVICKTNDRKTLGIMNERKYELFALFQFRFDITRFSNWDLLEDEIMDYLNKPREGKGYSRPVDELWKVLI
jgi:hypothetical protein